MALPNVAVESSESTVVIASPSEGVWVGRLIVADSGASQAKQVSYIIWSGGDGCTSDTGVEVQGLEDEGWQQP